MTTRMIGLRVSETRLGSANPCSSAHDETAVHRDGLASHVAGSVAAEPQNRIRNLLRAADPSVSHMAQAAVARKCMTSGEGGTSIAFATLALLSLIVSYTALQDHLT